MKALITDGVHEIIINGLKQAGIEVDYHPKISDAEVREIIAPYTILIVNSKISVDKDLMDLAPDLKIVGRLGSGMEIIDQDEARKRGIVCLNSPEGNRDAVAEHCVGMLLSLACNLKKSGNELENGIWNRESNRGWEISEKTIAIIGFGNTGSETAKRFAALGMNVLAYDKYRSNFGAEGIREAGLEEIFERAEVVSLHLPYTAETHHLVNKKFIEKFERPIFLINSSRGAIINTEEILTCLDQTLIRGACLDVFESEGEESFFLNQWNKQLLNKDNVILSPHVAGWTVESKERLARVLYAKIMRFI